MTTTPSTHRESNAPLSQRPHSIVKIEFRHDGVAIVTLDDPAETYNTITPALGGELTAVLDAIEADPKVIAVVLRSGKKDSFLVGANIDFVRSIRFAQDAEEASREVARRFGRFGTGKKPIVAYVHGPALGGGFELSLACTASVATDDPKTVLGLPEVKLGLIPAANGLFRVAERAGLRVALDLGITGRNVRPAEAQRLGLVDDVVASGIGLDVAVDLALRLAKNPRLAAGLRKKRTWLASRGMKSVEIALLEKNPIGRAALFRRARRELLAKTHGHYPAAERVVDLLERFGRRGFKSAAELEPRYFGDLVVSETAHRLIDLFFAQTALKKDTGLEANEHAIASPVEHVGVLGAGLMGAGIAAVTARSGMFVRLKDTNDVALGRGLAYVRDATKSRRRDGDALSRITTTTDYSGFRSADLVIEAVFEDIDLKHTVIRDLEKVVKSTCVIASNTSSIPIARIAEASTRPEMIVGMHYFSPVHKMPLVEVIRTKQTDPRAVATAVQLGKRQGKTVIVVADSPAFYTTRILVPYLNEAAHILSENTTPLEAIDKALVDWGFAVGPFQLLDEVGIDVGAHVGGVVQAAFGERMRPPEAFAKLRADDRKGKKNARGFYLYGSSRSTKRSKKAKLVDPTVYGVLGLDPATYSKHGGSTKPESHDDIALRCALAMVNEALRACDERVVRSPRDGDIGAIFGVGFPPFRGGPFRYVDVLGANEVLRRMRSLEQRFGARFEPAPLLIDMARTGKRFY